jgi:hypothetical protein
MAVELGRGLAHLGARSPIFAEPIPPLSRRRSGPDTLLVAQGQQVESAAEELVIRHVRLPCLRSGRQDVATQPPGRLAQSN